MKKIAQKPEVLKSLIESYNERLNEEKIDKPKGQPKRRGCRCK